MTFAAAVPGPDGQPLDQIRLAGVTATGHHGVLAHERADGQVFSADVVLHLDTRAAASSDDLGRTVSYADVAQDVHDVLAGSPADLVETVAERIAAVVLSHDAVQAVDVRVHKPQAPIPVPFDDVAIVVRRDRARPPVVEAAPADEPEETAVPAPPVAPVVPPEPDVPAEPAGAVHAPVPPAPVAAVPAEAPAPQPPADPLDVTPAEPVDAVLALGANLGDAQVTLRQAVTDVDRLPGVQVMDVSPLARTAAVGGPEQPDYLNAVLVVRTTLSPRDLLRSTQQVEAQHGRVREERWGPRTLDVDIVQYGALVASAPDLELPHPRAKERAFVLVPWAEVAPDALLGGPGGGPVGQLAVTAPDRGGIRWLALDWLTGPTQTTGQVSAVAADAAPSAPVPQSAPAEPPHQSSDQSSQGAADGAQASYAPEAWAGEAYATESATPAAPTPEQYAPEQHTPERYAPEQYEPEQYAPESSTPDASTAGQHTPEQYPPEAWAPEQYAQESYAAPAPSSDGSPAVEPYAPEQYAPDQYTPAPPVVEPPAAPEPRRADPPAPDARAVVPDPFGSDADQPVMPRPFAPVGSPAAPAEPRVDGPPPSPHAPVPPAPASPFPAPAGQPEAPSGPATPPVSSFAPPAPQHEPVPPAPAPAAEPAAAPGPFAPFPETHPGVPGHQERFGEDGR
ncbi:2-amino-4-hydroxy-6-hydroxymethyldihydropteridine diphosphokinase [Isoptericola sp. NPDC019693]|uniref:2-amino-4-hydroxy-6- hydroxymethyldihydropteridine diphosphokinase n=1 Tax=Isoptericola sp. NPDC019693 TaxID=3364009 RepID=UPI0037AAF449